MSSGSDSLQASSTSAEALKTITGTSSESGGTATAAYGGHRVNMVRQTSATSVPITPSISITVDVPVRRNPQNVESNPDGRGNPLPEYKPTVARCANGFQIYYDSSSGSLWRDLRTGRFAKPPAEHKPGGRFYPLPIRPGYDAEAQREQLKGPNVNIHLNL